MARGRMLDKRFTKSKKLNGLPRDYRLVYAGINCYLDREGRISGRPIVLKANVFLDTDFELDEIAAAVRAMADAGLIRLYASDDHAAIIEYVHFDRFNSPNRNEAPSDFPGPEDEGVTEPYDPLLAPSSTQNEDARAMHVQRTADAPLERKRKRKREEEGEPNDGDTAEARTMEALTTGRAESVDAPRARAFFHRLIGRENTKHPQARDNLTRWYQQHDEPTIRRAWEAAKTNPDGKPALFWFVDALNGTRALPRDTRADEEWKAERDRLAEELFTSPRSVN
jgi:hypothetical protein